MFRFIITFALFHFISYTYQCFYLFPFQFCLKKILLCLLYHVYAVNIFSQFKCIYFTKFFKGIFTGYTIPAILFQHFKDVVPYYFKYHLFIFFIFLYININSKIFVWSIILSILIQTCTFGLFFCLFCSLWYGLCRLY